MAKRRYVAPARGAVSPACFSHPAFGAFAARRGWLDAPDWPGIDALDAAMHELGAPERFVAQDAALLAENLHYELRIARHATIPTRPANWHDLLNAMVWTAYPSLKRALNARQVAEIARVGPSQRSRAQCALTHFDEGGAIVVIRDPALLPLWDAHDWTALFWRERDAWLDGRIEVVVFGHALLEHALTPDALITAKCVAVLDLRPGVREVDAALATVAQAVAAGRALDDPQELRPLPLSGIPGWHPGASSAAFFAEADCFRPLRAGRVYPAPIVCG